MFLQYYLDQNGDRVYTLKVKLKLVLLLYLGIKFSFIFFKRMLVCCIELK